MSERGDGYEGESTEDEYNPVMNVEAGTFEQLPEGVSFTSFDPQHSTNQFGTFVKQIIRSVASGLNISYASLSNDLESVNYSSIRQGALEERHYYKSEQRFLIEHFLQPVFEVWLLMAILSRRSLWLSFQLTSGQRWELRFFQQEPLRRQQQLWGWA